MRLLPCSKWLTRRISISRLLQATPPHGAVHHTSTTNVAPVEIPRLLVKPGSPNHNSLATYLEYAARTKLRPDRTVYIGTHYEYTAAEALQRLGFSLIRTGMKNDAGIDLIGHWMLSFLREPMPIIVQCKSRTKACSPDAIRELEGAFRSVPHNWQSQDVLGLLISNQRATEGLRRQMYLSPRPLAFLQISQSGTITQFVWNRAATDRGLEGVGVTPRYTVLPPETIHRPEDCPRDANGRFISDPYAKLRRKGVSRAIVSDIQLTWMGTPISPDSAQVARETARRLADIAQTKLAKSMEVKRKPGRPPGSKNKPKIVPTAAVTKDGRPLRVKSEVKATTVAVDITRRGPGRPTKEWIEKWSRDANGQISPKLVPPKGKPRRKPKKTLQKIAGSGNVPAESAIPRKRGRPKKIIIEPDG